MATLSLTQDLIRNEPWFFRDKETGKAYASFEDMGKVLDCSPEDVNFFCEVAREQKIKIGFTLSGVDYFSSDLLIHLAAEFNPKKLQMLTSGFINNLKDYYLAIEESTKTKKSLSKNKTTWIYVIECSVTGVFKLGRSTNPSNRLETIQTSYPYPLRIIATKQESSVLTERLVHKKIASFRLNGEWFSKDGMSFALKFLRE